jgi:kynurenine formamidase
MVEGRGGNDPPGLEGVRIVDLSKTLDPATENRRCTLRRHYTVVNGVGAYHTDIDITSHLGTHLELPYHFNESWKDGSKLPPSAFVGRGVLLNLQTATPNAPIRRADLDQADCRRTRPGDTVLLDSPFHSEPFVFSEDDRRPDISKEAGLWALEKKLKCVGWGDGVAIENEAIGCVALHEILLGNDILIIEVMKNLDQLRQDVFLIVYAPPPIAGLDSCPVRVMAI